MDIEFYKIKTFDECIWNKYLKQLHKWNKLVENWIIMKEIFLEKKKLSGCMNEYLDSTRNV